MAAVRPALLGFVAALGLAGLALGLRIHQIGNASLWLDEGYTLLFSRLPLDRLFLVGGAHEHPPFYYLVVHFVLDLRDSPLVPRIVSAVAGSASVLALYALGAQLFGRLAGLLAAALATISPFHVWYAQDGRAYELAGLLVLFSYLFLFKALEHPRRIVWFGYAGCVALALYTEYTTLFVLLPQALLMIRARQRGAARSMLRAWLVAALTFAPWVATLVLDASSIAGDYWIPPPTRDSVVGTALEFLGLRTPCTSPPCTGSEAHFPILASHELAVVGTMIVGVLFVLAVAIVRRRLTLCVLLLWLVLPFALVLVLASKRSLYLDRVFLDATFPLYLLVAAAAALCWRHVRRAALVTGLLALLGIANIANLQSVYSDPNNPDWRTAARDLQIAYRPGQAVVFNPGVLRTVVAAYLPDGWRATRERPIWYHNYLDVPSWQGRFEQLVDSYMREGHLDLRTRYMRLDGALRDRQLSRVTSGVRQVWLVTQDYAGFTDTRRWFAAHGFHLLLSELYFNDSRIELWDRRLPNHFGPQVFRDDGFSHGWLNRGSVATRAGVLTQNGPASSRRSFAVTPGSTYVANVEYQGIPPAYPTVTIQTYDRKGQPVGTMVDRFGNRLESFPRTEWYDLPVNGVWLSQPFGFIAPPGAVRATLRLQTRWGQCSWRNIAVYRERPRRQASALNSVEGTSSPM
jgi:4-amino-4-deoxy-L-arabinose transferase-like glycosyltransferase